MMRTFKKTTLIMMIILLGAFHAQAGDGIKFTKSSWEKVLAKAKKQKKNIFVDCYTTWCGPCKLMDKKTFTDPAVGEFFNKNYISVKIDMESPEGIALNQYFYVSVYPTLLFLDSQGNTLVQVTGYHDSNKFLEVGKNALKMPVKKKYGKINLAKERKKEANFQKNKFFNMVKNVGYKVENKAWKETLEDAKTSGKTIMAIYGDTYWPLREVMTKPENIKYLSDNFELKVVSLLNSYLKDEDGEILKDEDGNLLVSDWLTKYSPSSYPGVLFINAQGDKLVDCAQDEAVATAKLVQQGFFKPFVGFLESAKRAGLNVYDGQSKEKALKQSKEENKPLMIIWYRNKGNDINPHFGNEKVKAKLNKSFVVLALTRNEAIELDKKFPYRGSGSFYLVHPDGKLLGSYHGSPALTKEEIIGHIDNTLSKTPSDKKSLKSTEMDEITPAKKVN